MNTQCVDFKNAEAKSLGNIVNHLLYIYIILSFVILLIASIPLRLK